MKKQVVFANGENFIFDDCYGSIIGKMNDVEYLTIRVNNKNAFNILETQIKKKALENGCFLEYAVCDAMEKDVSNLRQLDYQRSLNDFLLLHPHECKEYSYTNYDVICGVAIVIKLNECLFKLVVIEADFKSIIS